MHLKYTVQIFKISIFHIPSIHKYILYIKSTLFSQPSTPLNNKTIIHLCQTEIRYSNL